jgi:predicted nucleotidyltransferase
MAPSTGDVFRDLPAPVVRVLSDLVARAPEALGDTLRAIVLFGSAAEGRLRSTSDVNIAVVLDRFEPARIDPIRELIAAGSAAVRLNVMWLLEREITDAADAFAVKFADISRRRRVLHGTDPFASLSIPREAAIRRLRQVLLNLILRLRSRYAIDSLREERLALLIADAAAPLRASAGELIELEGGPPAASPREALERVARALSNARAGGAPAEDWDTVLAQMREARETGQLAPGVAPTLVVRIMDLACHLRERVSALK